MTTPTFGIWEVPAREPAPAEEDVPEGPTVGLLFSECCQHLIREFLCYKEDHVGKSVAHDHCLDALCYACMGVAER